MLPCLLVWKLTPARCDEHSIYSFILPVFSSTSEGTYEWSKNKQRACSLQSSGNYIVEEMDWSSVVFLDALIHDLGGPKDRLYTYTFDKVMFPISQGKAFILSLQPQKNTSPRKERRLEVFMKGFVSPDIWNEWGCAEASCSECHNMPRVLDLLDIYTHRAIFFSTFFVNDCISNVKGNSLRNQLLWQFSKTFKRQVNWQ